ncbi:hypothetical protein ACWFRF_15375 [Nocardia sp. NPDC055165]
MSEAVQEWANLVLGAVDEIDSLSAELSRCASNIEAARRECERLANDTRLPDTAEDYEVLERARSIAASVESSATHIRNHVMDAGNAAQDLSRVLGFYHH